MSSTHKSGISIVTESRLIPSTLFAEIEIPIPVPQENTKIPLSSLTVQTLLA